MIEGKIAKWEDFLHLIEQTKYLKYANSVKHIQFRGQSKHEWKLTSSLKRIVDAEDIDEEKAWYYERQSRTEYIAQYHLLNEQGGFLLEEMNEEALFIDMQHFSCPTRVIDWSNSPYVALYFAVSENIDCDGAFYLWNHHIYLEAMKTRYPGIDKIEAFEIGQFKNYDVVQLVFATRKNERIVRQQATFSIANKILADHCDLIDIPTGWGGEGGLYKFTIPSDLKLEFLARLKTMNISASSLFPGIDGFGRSIKESLLIRRWSKL